MSRGANGDCLLAWNGKVDEAHRCAALRAAVEHVPAQGPKTHNAHEDLLDYAEKVC